MSRSTLCATLLDLKRYNLFAEWAPGESYTFEVDSAAIRGLYGLFSDKIKKDFKAKKLEEYGQIFFNVHGADSLAFVELLDGQDKVLRTVIQEKEKFLSNLTCTKLTPSFAL